MEKRSSSLSWNWLICTLSHFSLVVNACCIPESCSAYHLKTKKYFEGLTVTFQIRIIYWLPSYLWMVPLLSQDISLVDNMVVQSKSFFVSVSNHFLFSWGIGLCFWVTGDYWSITWWNALSPLGTSDWCYFDVADCNGETVLFFSTWLPVCWNKICIDSCPVNFLSC